MREKTAGMIWVLLAISLLNPAASGGEATESNPDVAYVAETHYDFGVVKEGREILHTFRIYNKGTTALTITDVRTD